MFSSRLNCVFIDHYIIFDFWFEKGREQGHQGQGRGQLHQGQGRGQGHQGQGRGQGHQGHRAIVRVGLPSTVAILAKVSHLVQ